MKRKLILIGVAVLSAVLTVGGFAFSSRHSISQPLSTTSPPQATWELREGGVWKPTGTPPPCPDPLVFATPVNAKEVTAILYPGQPRAEAWKPHGGFRFNMRPTNNVTVAVPFDATVVRGSRAFRSGENQYAFEFMAPCGIWYSFGHILEVSPKFQAMADKLPLIGDYAKQQFFDIVPPVEVKQGEVIATAVGYAKTKNVFVEWGVLDLRHTNGATLRPEWSQYANEFDHYAVCWLDFLPAADKERLTQLFGSGDAQTGTKSDYCHYAQNK